MPRLENLKWLYALTALAGKCSHHDYQIMSALASCVIMQLLSDPYAKQYEIS